MTNDLLKRNIDTVLGRIAKAQARSGRKVTLVAATKTVPCDIINAAIDFGINDVGENRVQEFIQKKDGVKGAKRHFIGTLQTNKAKYLVGEVALIQSVNSVKLMNEIDRLAKKRNAVQDILIEVNVGGERTKTGVDIVCADELIGATSECSNVRLRGLMSVMPIGASDDLYADIENLFARYESGPFDTLSVGMSGDYERAIEHGSNMVRIGSAIFGARQYNV